MTSFGLSPIAGAPETARHNFKFWPCELFLHRVSIYNASVTHRSVVLASNRQWRRNLRFLRTNGLPLSWNRRLISQILQLNSISTISERYCLDLRQTTDTTGP